MTPRMLALAVSIAVAALVIPSLALAGEGDTTPAGTRACESQEPPSRSSGSGTGRGDSGTVLGPVNCNEPGAPKGCPTSGGWNLASVQSAEDAARDKNRDGRVCKRFRQFKGQPVEVVDNYVVNGSFSCNNPSFCDTNGSGLRRR